MRLRNPEKVHLINFSTYYCKLLLRRMETWSRYSIGLFLINEERISKISSKRGKILARVYTRYDRRMGFSWREPFVRRHFPLESKPRSPPMSAIRILDGCSWIPGNSKQSARDKPFSPRVPRHDRILPPASEVNKGRRMISREPVMRNARGEHSGKHVKSVISSFALAGTRVQRGTTYYSSVTLHYLAN